ncbi:MAG: zinc-binding dehydrogenase [Clostridia bacterium]|nr:zinc-binding dehydrogenase [Clostridia bacterium]
MSCKQIYFPKAYCAEMRDVDFDTKPLAPNELRIKNAFNTISNGTEKANYSGDPNTSIYSNFNQPAKFPRAVGYSSSGTVTEIGSSVTRFKVGDRVAVCGSKHAQYNIVDESNTVLLDDSVSFQAASMLYISTFPLAALRKTKIEAGESIIVMGLGPLGLLAVQLAHISGAVPVIAVDPIQERREKALKFGADFALDPFDPNFAKTAKELSGGKGCNAGIEVTGLGSGLDGILDCMAPFGRVALLGCTRSSDFSIDYYRKVHGPGITLIGAHTLARPQFESYPGYFTSLDDMETLVKLIKYKRLDLDAMVDEVWSPLQCSDVFSRLASDKGFPPFVQFDWSKM